MAYTALETMRERNRAAYGIDAPVVPSCPTGGTDLERRALHFIRERCEGLRFDPAFADLTDAEGTSLRPRQIPKNMERDLDRLCLERAVQRFLGSGTAEDAFDVYYIWLEMFMGGYRAPKKMIELLSEFESNASALLMKHRDHYSHSVYVFLIGLAVFDSSETFRAAYRRFYGLDETETACRFLRVWGLTALFHDVGYPFELPFEQIKSYFGETRAPVPYLAYRDTAEFLKLRPEDAEKARRLSPAGAPSDRADILVRRIAECFGARYAARPRAKVADTPADAPFSDYLTAAFRWRAADPGAFENRPAPGADAGYTYNKNIYMDHAWFSALLLMDVLFRTLPAEAFDLETADALIAVALHNSVFKHIVQNRFGGGFSPEACALPLDEHPLSWLLMLCDELQAWDRTAYGQNSRREVHAFGCALRFDGDAITADYRFDAAMAEKAKRPDVKGTYKKMKTDAAGVTAFQRDIEEIVAVNRGPGALSLRVSGGFAEVTRYRKTYLSHSSFLHLYDFAVTLSGRRDFDISRADADAEMRAQMEEKFERKSLEYKMIDIERVKMFARYLDAIGCFYTDRPVAYPPLRAFTKADMDVIGPMEHQRWLWGHHVMGWTWGDAYEKYGKEEAALLRERTRTHKLMLPQGDYTRENALAHYRTLPAAEQAKDTEPMNRLLAILSMLDGVKFYRLAQDEDDTM